MPRPVTPIASAPRTRRAEHGQILVIFTLALVAMVGMVGLVIDGGSAFAQRRDEQSTADLASLAGATAYLNTTGDSATRTAAAIAAAQALATANGYTTDVTAGVSVDVVVDAGFGFADVQVAIAAPHQNTFAGLLGMPTWGVAVDATSKASGQPNAAIGPLPLLFNQEAFDAMVCSTGSGTCPSQVFNEPAPGSEDVPQDATNFNWTIFCTAQGQECNADSDGVEDLMDQDQLIEVVRVDTVIAPLNAGSHATLYDSLRDLALVGEIYPVPIVDDAGVMLGFAYFRLTDYSKQAKTVSGYFLAPYDGGDLTYIEGAGDPSENFGGYVLKLID